MDEIQENQAEEVMSAIAGQPDDQHEVVIKYYKSNFFRVIHADGAWGGLSARGDIHISFYNERAAIPDISRFVISGGEIIKPEEFQSISKVVREVEVDVVVDLGTAMSLRDWLNDRIDALQTLISENQIEEGKDASKEKTNA